MRGNIDHAICYQERVGPDRVLDVDGLMLTKLEIWIIEDLQVGMCLTYLEEL